MKGLLTHRRMIIGSVFGYLGNNPNNKSLRKCIQKKYNSLIYVFFLVILIFGCVMMYPPEEKEKTLEQLVRSYSSTTSKIDTIQDYPLKIVIKDSLSPSRFNEVIIIADSMYQPVLISFVSGKIDTVVIEGNSEIWYIKIADSVIEFNEQSELLTPLL